MALSFVLNDLQEQKFAWINLVPVSLDQTLLIFKNYFRISITEIRMVENGGNNQMIEILSFREEKEHRLRACIISEFPKAFYRSANSIEKVDPYTIRFKYNREEDLRELFCDLTDFLWINHFINQFNLNLLCCRFLGSYLYTEKDVAINFIESKSSQVNNLAAAAVAAGVSKGNIPQPSTITTLAKVNLLQIDGEYGSSFVIQFTNAIDSKTPTLPSKFKQRLC